MARDPTTPAGGWPTELDPALADPVDILLDNTDGGAGGDPYCDDGDPAKEDVPDHIYRDLDAAGEWDELQEQLRLRGFAVLPLVSPKGGDPAEWPADLRVREWPDPPPPVPAARPAALPGVGP